MHAPGQRGVDAVVAIARQQAANPAYTVSHSSRGGREIEHPDRAHARARGRTRVFRRYPARAFETSTMPLAHQHSNPGYHSPKPRETVAEPAQKSHGNVDRMVPAWPGDDTQGKLQFGHILQFMPYLCPNDAQE